MFHSLLLMMTSAAFATNPVPFASPEVSAPLVGLPADHAPAKDEKTNVKQVEGSVASPVKVLDRRELVAKVLSQGVPEHGFQKILDFIDKNTGKDFVQDAYQCSNFPSESPRTCDENLRLPTSQKLTLREQTYVVLVDFALPSTVKRLFLINLKTGDVEKYLAAHGRGSGVNAVAWKFSNTKDSKQTALGMYMTGGTYNGHFGLILRMYGLEKSNDQAYNRDIVLHGATYATESFMSMRNPITDEPFDRLGVSWGCPAVSISAAKKLIPLLMNGALIYHDHKDLVDEALSGKEVFGKEPDAPPSKLKNVPLPIPRPPEFSKDVVRIPMTIELKSETPVAPLRGIQVPSVLMLEAGEFPAGEFDPATISLSNEETVTGK